MDSEVSTKEKITKEDIDNFEPVLVKKRWLMLFLFASVSMLNAFQWLHINIVAESAIFFWNASLPAGKYEQDVAIAWLSMVYMIVYIPVIVPATWILNRYGLRLSILIGAILNALGAWLKCLSMEFSQASSVAASPMGSSSFPILMIAQTICATGQTLLLGVPAQLAATWFGKSELALATSIGVFGNQVGCALGFGLPPLMVPSVDFSNPATFDGQFDGLKKGFRILFYGGAAIMTLDLLIVAVFFRNEPKIAPSRAQYKRILQRRGQLAGDHPTDDEVNSNSQEEISDKVTSEMTELAKQSYFNQVKYSFKSLSFIWLNICYGVNTGVYYEIGTLLSVILLEFFPTEQVAIGWVGFSMVIAGLIGSIVAGIVLKKTGLYRRVLIIFYFLSVVSMGAFTGSVYSYSIALVFVTMILLGFFQSGFLPLGFEYAAEITYPVDEGLSSGILNTSAHIFGIILTLVATALEGKYGGLSANLFMLVSMALAAIPACFMKDDLKRQRAHEKMILEVEVKSDEEEEEEEGDDVTEEV